MTFKLEAGVNVLWQNLIALNASIMRENEEQKAELLHTKQLLQQEVKNSNVLQEKNAIQQQKIAKLYSKMVAVRQIVSYDPEDHNDQNNKAANLPVIVKVESVESDAPDYENTSLLSVPINVCNECDKKFRSSSELKSHMVFHLNPTVPCPNCTRKFPRKDYMKKHFRKVHQIENFSSIGHHSTRSNTNFCGL